MVEKVVGRQKTEDRRQKTEDEYRRKFFVAYSENQLSEDSHLKSSIVICNL